MLNIRKSWLLPSSRFRFELGDLATKKDSHLENLVLGSIWMMLPNFAIIR